MKFVDLESGYLYDGCSPYIHWFSGEQSTDLIYCHKLCIISNSNQIELEMDSNIFNIIDNSKLIEGNNYSSITCQSFTSNAEVYNGVNMHIINFTASSKTPGEYTTDVLIKDGGESYNLILGADFYMENESLYINLANMGVELPDAIQKAIYDVNVSESNRDNITLNRKMKELLSNYWDMIANKGSYKSLINTLKWFEWGDLVKLKEIWKRDDFGRIVYDDRSLCSILEDKYIDTLNGFSKTTHLALYANMQNICPGYDDEKNPKLEEVIIPKWTREDLMLKLCMLGNFYETYFIPIHLNLFQSTVENVVFTNTFKTINSNMMDRYDHITNIGNIKCNIKNNSSYILSDVSCQVNNDTMFGTKWNGEESYNDINIIGVDDIVNEISEDDLKTFYSQIFNGIGVIVPFECNINTYEDDYIVESLLTINDKTIVSNKVIYNIDGKIDINFKVLFQQEGIHDINIQFKTAGSKLYTKHLTLNILDVSGMDLKVYRVMHYKYLDDEYIKFMKNKSADNLIFNRYKNKTHSYTTQYIPTTSSLKTSGVCLNNILVLKGDYINDYILKQYYHIFKKESESQIYTICVSKSFWFNPEINIYEFSQTYGPNIYRNDYGYFSEFHYLSEMNYDKESLYNITDNDVVCIIPELPKGLYIDDWDWEFINVTRNEIIKLPNYQEPYVADIKKSLLSTGYYDVVFKYKIGNDVKTLTKKSIFRKI